MSELWQMLSDGLVWINYQQSAPENWQWKLTERGIRAAKDKDYDPDDPESFLLRLRQRIQDLDDLVIRYTSEAVHSYHSACYLACAVMVGVASERAFQLLGEAFVSWPPAGGAEAFQRIFESPRQNYVAKFREFRKALEPQRANLPADLRDNLALTLDSVLDLLRVMRNEAGHPTGREIDRDEAYVDLQMLARYLQTLYRLRAHFSA
jgi:hypothetical protein